MVITDAKALLAWIEASLPEVAPAAFGPWLAEPAGPGAVSAVVHIRVESAARPARSIVVVLSAHPITVNDSAS
ncbi:hypothetical protein [Nocardia sp. NBC_01388]|uniref:hypothetical protein n=1 Tax=Nocardia sp. NBC_01388 TaxID=2903596 RepID=UPI003245DC62